MPEPDATLLQRSAAGDAEAFSAFVKRHESSVFRYIGTLTSEPADAEDALQETFVAAWRHASAFRGGETARPWLFSIGRNAVRKQHRRRAGEPEHQQSLDTLGGEAGWGNDDPAPLLTALADRDLLARALGDLSAADREILVMRELEGFTGEEAADLLRVSLPAMKSRLHRARLRFMVSLRRIADV